MEGEGKKLIKMDYTTDNAIFFFPRWSVLSILYFSPLKFNDLDFSCLEHLRFYLMALDGGNKELAQTILYSSFLSGPNLRRNFFSLQRFVEQNEATKLNLSGHVWSLDGSLIVYLRLFQLRWTQDKFFADHCRKSYIDHNGDFVVFVECGNSTFWTCGKVMDEIKNQQDLFTLPGQNIRGWILTFVTHFNCLLQQDGGKKFTREEAFNKTKAFFAKVLQINPGQSAMFQNGLRKLLSSIEKFDKSFQENKIWLDLNTNYNPDLHGVNKLEEECDKEEEMDVTDKYHTTKYMKRFSQGIVIFSLGYFLGVFVCLYQLSFDLL